jgi:hypothetical protein
MLGWMISIHRQLDGGVAPAKPDCPRGPSLAVWQAGSGGLAWLDELVKQNRAIDLGGSGYPLWYTAPANELIAFVAESPPLARSLWHVGENNVVLPGWIGKTQIDSSALSECRSDEWLVIEAWDES